MHGGNAGIAVVRQRRRQRMADADDAGHVFLHHTPNTAIAQRIVARALAGNAVERLVGIGHLTVRADEFSAAEEKVVVGVENNRPTPLGRELQTLKGEV